MRAASHVRTLVLAVEPGASHLKYLHQVQEGIGSRRNYMTELLAEIAGLPTSVCANAKSLAQSVDFDPVDVLSIAARTREAYGMLYGSGLVT